VPGGPVALGCFGPVWGEVFELGLGEWFGVEEGEVEPGGGGEDDEEEEGEGDEDDFFHMVIVRLDRKGVGLGDWTGESGGGDGVLVYILKRGG